MLCDAYKGMELAARSHNIVKEQMLCDLKIRNFDAFLPFFRAPHLQY